MKDTPLLSDGTCDLRAYTDADQVYVADWLSGPRSHDRRSTDGGPSTNAEHVNDLIGDLKHQYLYIVEVDGQRCGMAALDELGEHSQHSNAHSSHSNAGNYGILTLILSDECYWHQGIGDRAVALLRTLAFEHYSLVGLAVHNIPEAAEVGRLAWENAGFGQQSRIVHQGQVLVNFSLTRASYLSHEQRILLVRHAQHDLDSALCVSGNSDQLLNSVGRAQTEGLATSHLLFGITSCICADLQQNRSTAERAFDQRSCASVIDSAWCGQDLGTWQGMLRSDIPQDDTQTRSDPPAGESNKDFRTRCLHAFERLPHGEDIAIVTHGENICCILNAIQTELLGAPGLRTGNGIKASSITELRRGPDGWRVIRISDDRHIRARKATVELSQPLP